MNIYEFAKTVQTQEDFSKFLEMLIDDFSSDNESWDNDTLMRYLDGMYGYSLAEVNTENCWQMFANFLLAAKVYE